VSLRARLMLGLLALAAVGLITLAAITYAEQRNFLYDRIDQQATSALRFTMARLGGPGPGGPAGGEHYGPQRGAPGGTCTLRRTLSGIDIEAPDCPLSYGGVPPRLPAGLPLGKLTTVRATNSDTRYRVLALVGPDGNVRVAAVPMTDVDQTLRRLLRIEGLVIVAILAALAALAWWVVRLGLRPLDRMGTTAGAIAAGDLSQRVEDAGPSTEVGRLGLSLNRMLDRLEQAFAEREASEHRLRRFLADASHELRTPLASIRGYAELFRIGAVRRPQETERAMSRIESEAARMGVLVEDLLTLARLDEVRDAAREDVDLARLAGDAVDDARATAPDRVIDLIAHGPVVAHGDPHQLRQVLANLMRNALVHTPPGTGIEVTVARDDGHVTLEVRDHGPGLPTDDPQELFDRFWRAEAGRERGRAGAGLGLAIVAGIVHAHGGEVHAADAPTGGARFTVRLPVEGRAGAER
jgi:two-component system OmpR family sensor kinase